MPRPSTPGVHILRDSRFIRFTGSLLLICLGFLVAESLIADACDGDASAQRVADAWVHDGPATGVNGGAELPGQPHRAPEAPPSHSMHVDHCVHPHAGAPVAGTWFEPMPAVAPAKVLAESELAPPSPTLEPLPRPPAA